MHCKYYNIDMRVDKVADGYQLHKLYSCEMHGVEYEDINESAEYCIWCIQNRNDRDKGE